MARDYIPDPDGDFNTWQENFMTYAGANLAALGLVAADLMAVTAAQADWDTAYAASNSAQITARTAAQFKKDKRSAYDSCIRALVRRLQASPAVSNEERRALGITVQGDNVAPAGPAASRPLGMIDTSQRLRHEIRFVDEATPTSRAKPAGVMGCKIWVKVGATPPADPSELTFLALDTASPYIGRVQRGRRRQDRLLHAPVGQYAQRKGGRGAKPPRRRLWDKRLTK